MNSLFASLNSGASYLRGKNSARILRARSKLSRRFCVAAMSITVILFAAVDKLAGGICMHSYCFSEVRISASNAPRFGV